MIRTAYPLSFLKQAQLRLGLAPRRARRTRRANVRRHDASVAPAAEMASAPKTENIARADEKDEKAMMNAFYNRYDNLTGLICLAAQEGVTPVREARYQSAREWFVQTYTGSVRPFLAPYLQDEAQSGDPFACFWSPPTLADLLQSDDGDYIARMERTQNALAAWENAL